MAGLAAVYVFEDPYRALSDYESAAVKGKERGRCVWALCAGEFHSAG